MPQLPSTYKTYIYERYGAIEDVLKVKDAATEPLEATHIRINVAYASLNPADPLMVEGAGERLTGGFPSPDKPYHIGFDVAGVVVEVGEKVEGKFKVGEQVFAITSIGGIGTVAEYISIEPEFVAHKPESLDLKHAAAVPAVSLTSYQGIVEHAKLQKDERILIVGGSTSAGMYAIQHAKAIGAYVIATASTAKVDFIKSIGADEVIDYTSTKWNDVVPRHSLDVFYDCGIEPTSWDGDAQLVLKKGGSRFVTLEPGDPATASRFGATHSGVFCYPSGQQLTEIGALIDAGEIKVVVDSVFPFDKTLEALAKVKSRRVLGKVLIEI